MTTIQPAHSREMSLLWSAVFRVVRLLIFGLVGWLWFMSANDSAWRAVSLAAVLAIATLVGIPWYLSRARTKSAWRAALAARAENRWRAALDRYAEQEQ